MHVKYCVKYRRYQYNMCYRGHADNGYYDEENWYDTEDEAKDFAKRLKRLLLVKTLELKGKSIPDRAWERLGIYDGYGTKFIGLYKVTFEEIKCS